MKDPRDIIIRPIFTEKAEMLRMKYNQYVFEVAREATKPEIKKAIENLFKVKVLDVKVINVKPKPRGSRWRGNLGRTRRWKKAIVKLKPGDTIPIYEGA